jgi:hypothetical protein
MLIACVAAMVFNVLLYVASSVRFVWLLCWIMIPGLWAYTAKGFGPSARRAGWLVLAGIFLTSQLNNLVPLFFAEPKGKTENYPAIRTFVQEHPDRDYGIDSVAAYRIFDYQLPRNLTDWNYQFRPTEPQFNSLSQRPAGRVWIGQTFLFKRYLKDFEEEAPCVEIKGRKFNSMPRYPNEVSLIE